ncbi:MAG: UBA domain-containing protein [Endomicrobiales bacterium]
MQEKVRLLMEETGCEQGEAELALELAGNDLEKAIKTIGNLLRHITVLKGKFSFPSRNLYGLLLIVINTKTQEILRLSTVVSYNPALFENSPEMDWYTFEKLVFTYRLDGGSLPDFTQDIEQKLQSYLLAQKDVLVKCNTSDISVLLRDFFSPDTVTITLIAEELNLAQFRQLPDTHSPESEKVITNDSEPGTVWLQVEVVEDKSGTEVHRLIEGDVVLSQITDTRDIAHYLAHLIGGRKEGDMVPLPAVVRKISAQAEESEVQLYYAPGIVGIASVKNDLKIKVLETRTQPWWKKIMLWK